MIALHYLEKYRGNEEHPFFKTVLEWHHCDRDPICMRFRFSKYASSNNSTSDTRKGKTSLSFLKRHRIVTEWSIANLFASKVPYCSEVLRTEFPNRSSESSRTQFKRHCENQCESMGSKANGSAYLISQTENGKLVRSFDLEILFAKSWSITKLIFFVLSSSSKNCISRSKLESSLDECVYRMNIR